MRQSADASVTLPYLDAIIYLLGITREEVEAADAAATAAQSLPRGLDLNELGVTPVQGSPTS